MIHRPIPVCLTLTQCGNQVPPELPDAGHIRRHLATDPAREAMRQVFDLSHRMDAVLIAAVAPEIVQLHLPPDDALPDSLEGMPLYPATAREKKLLRDAVLAQYYAGFYRRLDALQARADIRLGVDCVLYDDAIPPAEGLRSFMSLNNLGDRYGEAVSGAGGTSCPPDMIRDVRDICSARFADMGGSILVNTPAMDNHLIRHRLKGGIPWLALLVGRSLLKSGPDGNISQKRIENLRDRFENVWIMICKYYEWL